MPRPLAVLGVVVFLLAAPFALAAYMLNVPCVILSTIGEYLATAAVLIHPDSTEREKQDARERWRNVN